MDLRLPLFKPFFREIFELYEFLRHDSYLYRGYFVESNEMNEMKREKRQKYIYVFFLSLSPRDIQLNEIRFFFIFDRIFLSLFFLPFFLRGRGRWRGGCYFFAVRYTSITWKRNILSISVSPGFRIIKTVADRRSIWEIQINQSTAIWRIVELVYRYNH